MGLFISFDHLFQVAIAPAPVSLSATIYPSFSLFLYSFQLLALEMILTNGDAKIIKWSRQDPTRTTSGLRIY